MGAPEMVPAGREELRGWGWRGGEGGERVVRG